MVLSEADQFLQTKLFPCRMSDVAPKSCADQPSEEITRVD